MAVGIFSSLVVYLLIPTSNHNQSKAFPANDRVVYLLIPTSNHNCGECAECQRQVVYLLIPTSNHNQHDYNMQTMALYIF